MSYDALHFFMGNRRTQAVGYVRVSTESQADAGVSLDAQRAKLTAYATALDLELIAVGEDAGVSREEPGAPRTPAGPGPPRKGRSEIVCS